MTTTGSLTQLIARNVDRIMRDRQLTNRGVASKAGVSEGTVRNFRNRKGDALTGTGEEQSPQLRMVEQLATGLEVDPLELLVHEPAPMVRANGPEVAVAVALARLAPRFPDGGTKSEFVAQLLKWIEARPTLGRPTANPWPDETPKLPPAPQA